MKDLKSLFINKGIFIIISIIIIFLTYVRHSSNKNFTYQSEIWADRAGYYIYLPATFIYGYYEQNYPKDIVNKTGYGFEFKNGKLINKYPIGVAMMQLPFFTIAQIFSTPDVEFKGFTPIHHHILNYAAIFWLLLGLYWLQKFLLFFFKKIITNIVLIMICFATNLLYYVIDDGSMSHVYSFALFAGFIYYFKRAIDCNFQNSKEKIVISIIAALIILVRPINAIFLIFVLFLNINSLEELKNRFLLILKWKSIFFLLIPFILLIIPQLIYYKFAFNNYFQYSYGTERFYLLSPKILLFLFSPNNGMILYTPLYILIIFSIIYLIKTKPKSGLYFLFCFIFIVYIFSSWHSWNYGCSFGQRPFIEYLTFFSLPFAALISKLNEKSKTIKTFFLFLFISLIYQNALIIKAYDECFYGSSWDWNEYKRYYSKSSIMPIKIPYTHYNNFEKKEKIRFEINTDNKIKIDNNTAVSIDSTKEYGPGFQSIINQISNSPIQFIHINSNILPQNITEPVYLVTSIEQDTLINDYHAILINNSITKNNTWQKIEIKIPITKNLLTWNLLKIYFWNPNKQKLLIDNIKIKIS